MVRRSQWKNRLIRGKPQWSHRERADNHRLLPCLHLWRRWQCLLRLLWCCRFVQLILIWSGQLGQLYRLLGRDYYRQWIRSELRWVWSYDARQFLWLLWIFRLHWLQHCLISRGSQRRRLGGELIWIWPNYGQQWQLLRLQLQLWIRWLL